MRKEKSREISLTLCFGTVEAQIREMRVYLESLEGELHVIGLL